MDIKATVRRVRYWIEDRTLLWKERLISTKDVAVAIIKGMARQRLREVALWIDNRTHLRTDVCTHTVLKVAHAHVVNTDFGYAYWKALVKCRTCDEEWILQARTPGLLSSDPHSNIFRDSTT